MGGYGQFCPVSKAAEVFAQPWTPLILRGLMDGSHHFSELEREVPKMSRSLLVKRLKSLERDGLIERSPNPDGRGSLYHLTAAGEEFRPMVKQLGAWGQHWATAQLRQEDLDPRLLLWAMHRTMHTENLPPKRVVARFDFPRFPRDTCWLVLNRPEVEVCVRDPGWEPDLFVKADIMALTQVHLGRLDLREAMRRELVEVQGARSLVQEFPSWIGKTPFAIYV